MAVYNAYLRPGDIILSLGLKSGGHLSHGAKASFVSKVYKIVNYGLNKEELIDVGQIEQLIKRHKPKMLVAGFSAYCRDVDFKELA